VQLPRSCRIIPANNTVRLTCRQAGAHVIKQGAAREFKQGGAHEFKQGGADKGKPF
jgi:hypothetical protein